MIWWAAALIWAVLPLLGAPRIAVFTAIFAILACALFWYLFKRYKNFKPSKLFVKNPNLGLLFFFGREFIARRFSAGFGRIWRRDIRGNNASGRSAAFAFAFAPFCLIVFVISYVYEKSQTYAPFAPAKFYLLRGTGLGAI